MDELILLYNEEGTKYTPTLCGLRSVGHTEFYEAYANELRPEMKFVLADSLAYRGEPFVEHDRKLYRVLRTYRTGQEIELTVGRASAEEENHCVAFKEYKHYYD